MSDILISHIFYAKTSIKGMLLTFFFIFTDSNVFKLTYMRKILLFVALSFMVLSLSAETKTATGTGYWDAITWSLVSLNREMML